MDAQARVTRGEHGALVAETVDAGGPVAEAEIPWVIGALTFLGRQEEALALFTPTADSLSPGHRTVARAFLAIAATRHFDFPAARTHLWAVFRDRRGKMLAHERYFLFQAIAFHRYFEGRIGRAAAWADRAQSEAMAGSFLYGRVLSGDLLGHCEIQLGHVRRGLDLLRRARALAQGLGEGWVTGALVVTDALYRAQFGISGPTAVDELTALLDSERAPDAYNRQGLLLELARQQTLRGELERARITLAEAAQLVYQVQNPRLEAQLQLRLATVQFLRGDIEDALALAEHTVQRVAGKGHLVLELAARGLVQRIATASSKPVARPSDETAIIFALTHETRVAVGTRILGRAQGESARYDAPGQDPLGDLIDLVDEQGPRAAGEVIASGWFGLVPRALSLPPGCRALVLDLEGRSLTLVDRGDVHHLGSGFAGLPRRILTELVQHGPCSKERLCQAVWGHEYHPLRHDGLIYAGISKLRRMHPRLGDWILATEEGYMLAPGVKLIENVSDEAALDADSSSPATAAKRPESGWASFLAAKGLSLRHGEILRMAQAQGAVDARTVRSACGVSEITASRDLANLTEAGLLTRVGRGRATRYCLATPLSPELLSS